jgi:MoCo/4Fe-4S cofactor protein with predicted Tat translocation signal
VSNQGNSGSWFNIVGQAKAEPRREIDYAELRARLSNARGPKFWRTLEELADDPNFRAAVAEQFPSGATEMLDGVSRRNFLKLASVSLAMAGVTACTKQPLEPIVPYVRQPEGMTLGLPLWFATAMPYTHGIVRPLIVKSHEGRPTKAEGNPQHPASLGATCVQSQGSIYDLYDPDRSQTAMYLGDVRTWANFLGAIRPQVNAQVGLGGAGVRFLTGPSTSPTLAAQFAELRKKLPQMKWHVWEPINRDNVKLGAQQAFGQVVETRYDFSAADVVLSLDANFLDSSFPGFERYAREFAARRRPPDPYEEADRLRTAMLRFYALETTPTNTGGKADHRLGLKPGDFENFVGGLAVTFQGLVERGEIKVQGATLPGDRDHLWDWFLSLGKELQDSRGRSVIVPGDHASASIHAFAHQMNAALGNAGKTVFYTDPLEINPVIQAQSLKELVDDLNAGKVDVLVVSGTNPVFDAPADLDFAGAMSKARMVVHHGPYQDETSVHAHWHVPAAHYLESWSDGRAFDGTISIIQPLIAPLYDGKTAHELLAAFGDNPDLSSYEIVRNYWMTQRGMAPATGGAAMPSAPGAQPSPQMAEFETFWRRSVHDGFVANSALPAKTPGASGPPKTMPLLGHEGPFGAEMDEVANRRLAASQGGLEINFRPDPIIHDGRFANNAWLQELEKPLSTITWDNSIWIGPQTAQKLKLAFQDEVELELNGRKVRGPIYVQAGMPDNLVTVFTGGGRSKSGHTGNGFGFNAYAIRTSNALWSTSGVKITRTGEEWTLARIQPEQLIDLPEQLHARHLIRTADLEEYRQHPNFAQEEEEEPKKEETLYPEYRYDGYAWGMAIDLNSCVGCNTCIVACQAENNIPVVGKEEVLKRRAMHWLRVDTYYEGLDNPKIYFQPLPCMQCENAPCEYVCPVGATVHSTEGLNDMVYNRCVGTRYCSNNCPYKVRRFNFFLYQDWTTPQLKLMRNPEVSVRSRGVMEKCTYCIQRITKARIDSEKRDARIKDGEFTTACAQACPADAIVFGDINDPNSRVRKLKDTQRNYSLLGDLNTRPRTTYLAGVSNPNPELKKNQG